MPNDSVVKSFCNFGMVVGRWITGTFFGLGGGDGGAGGIKGMVTRAAHGFFISDRMLLLLNFK